jgi:uncharacterized Tic20 family protein
MQVSQAEFSHEADILTPLHHGVIRYEPADTLPASIRNALPAKNDRPFVFVPVGYTHREPDFMKHILHALKLELPNIVVVSAETTSNESSYHIRKPLKHPVAKDWPQDHTKEVLQSKTESLLESIVESAIGVGAWLLPDCPRRRNAAAQMICNSMPTGQTCVALGLMGLNEQDQPDVDLENSMKATMVPVGSPVRNVCKLVFDTSLKDEAPCPRLTHILVFETPQEKNTFRQALLDSVPDLLLVFGDVTKQGMQCVFRNICNGSPIIVLQHTGPNIDKLTRMFRHVKKYSEGDTLLHKLPPIPKEDDELVRLFVHTWPLGFQHESIVAADPLLTTAPDLQERLLEALTVCFGLKMGNRKSKTTKKKALDYAWNFYRAALNHASKKKYAAEILHIQLVLFTLLAITASVLYNQWYGGQDGHPDNKIQLIIYVATIILPLYVTSLKQESDKGVDLQTHAAFDVAAIRIHSEIFKFRCQVGPYKIEDKTAPAQQEAVETFTKSIRDIWVSVKPNMHEDGVALPHTFWDATSPLPSVDNLMALGGEDSANEQTPLILKAAEATKSVGSTAATIAHKAAVPIKAAATMLAGNNHADTPAVEHDIVVTPVITTDDASEYSDDSQDDDEENLNTLKPIFVDDQYTPIKVDDYMDIRMRVEMAKKTEAIQTMASRNQTFSTCIKFITMFSGAAAALSLQWLVPIVLGVTAAMSTGQDFRKYPHRIELGNDLIVQLNKLKLWWMGLSQYEKQLPHHKDHLVLTAEKMIVNELESAVGGSHAVSE